MQSPIVFAKVNQALTLPRGFSKKLVRVWLENVARSEGKEIKQLQYVLCDDSYLYDLNHEYLNHDTLTDIITFPYSSDPIEAEIYISVERTGENAASYGSGNELEELCRVIVHGLLHMCGYKDKTDAEKAVMSSKESFYLQELKF